MDDRYRLKQHGIPVAWADGPNASREIAHYAAVYSSDGSVEIEQRINGRWKRLSPDAFRANLTTKGTDNGG